MRRVVFALLAVTSLPSLKGEESAQYLQNAMRDLRYMKSRQPLKKVDVPRVETVSEVPVPQSIVHRETVDRRVENKGIPPLALTKGELAALYEAAVTNGDTVKLPSGDNSYIHAAVHELNASPTSHDEQKKPPDEKDLSGYYYYYYPVKSFLDEMSSQPSSPEHYYSPTTYKHPSTEKPTYQYHSHTHEHNVKITSEKDSPEKKKGLEPLFMAISGFVGMAVMFVLSAVVLPKFGIMKKSYDLKGNGKNERVADIARVALAAIEGKDCAERFACEFERTARAFHLQDNRFVKLLKRMAPGSFGKQMDKMGKFTKGRLKCTAIPCKKKNANKKPQKKS